MQHYYTYYLVTREKWGASLLDSVSARQEETTSHNPGRESVLGADAMLQEKICQDKTAVDLIFRQKNGSR